MPGMPPPGTPFGALRFFSGYFSSHRETASSLYAILRSSSTFADFLYPMPRSSKISLSCRLRARIQARCDVE